jgi:hypothetical protein
MGIVLASGIIIIITIIILIIVIIVNSISFSSSRIVIILVVVIVSAPLLGRFPRETLAPAVHHGAFRSMRGKHHRGDAAATAPFLQACGGVS